jgi:two-component system chemotaxis sensor kinase CheA
MAGDSKSISELLDEMAVKILMIEPGDLSAVGELIVSIEELLAHELIGGRPNFNKMVQNFQTTLEKVIMGELSDSAETFESLGQCIAILQDEDRRADLPDQRRIKQFCDILKTIGFEVDEASFSFEAPAEEKAEQETETEQQEEVPDEIDAPSPAAEIHDSPAPPATEPPSTSAPDTSFLQDKDLLKGFIEEAFEHLETIETNILELEQSPDDADIINNIFRPFHTIKGVSGFLNLKNINKLAHTTENLLDDVRNSRREMDADVIEVVLSVGDYLRSMIANIHEALEKGPEHYVEFDISEYVARVIAVTDGAASPVEKVAGTVAPVEKEEEPSAVSVEAPKPDEKAAAVAPAITEQAQTPHETDIAPAEDVSPSPPERESVKAVPQAVPEPKAVSQPAMKSKIGDSIKVDVEKLDSLVDAMGELVIMQSLIQQNPVVATIIDPKLARDFSQLSRIITELQTTAMSMRMVPIRQTFQKMVRLVRDLTKKTGKEANLVMSGEETEIDRNMVDSIYDPLVHMMRNSVDHGVQTPDERRKNGKPPQGTVSLRAYQKGSSILIEIEDDGEGLDPDKIRKKAIERGIISESDDLSEHEIINLIMMAGFSMAEKITDVSGRGVGMDVVKKAVEKLRGKLEIHNRPKNGCLFTIRLPLTLAIIEGIVVRVGRERYIIPTVAIQESIRPLVKHYSTVHGKGETLMVRGQLVPIIRLYEVFQQKPTFIVPFEAIVVVVEYEGQRRALMVDELLGKQEVVIKSLGSYMKSIQGVAGGTILGDGKVGLILDLAGLLAYSDTMKRSRVVEAEPLKDQEVH